MASLCKVLDCDTSLGTYLSLRLSPFIVSVAMASLCKVLDCDTSLGTYLSLRLSPFIVSVAMASVFVRF